MNMMKRVDESALMGTKLEISGEDSGSHVACGSTRVACMTPECPRASYIASLILAGEWRMLQICEGKARGSTVIARKE